MTAAACAWRVLILWGLCGLAACGTVASADRAPAVLRAELINPDAPYPQSHASTIVENASGELLAAWFGGVHERHPTVGIWLSRYTGSRWQAAVEVAAAPRVDGVRYPCWNPVLFQPPAGDLHLFYKVGPNPREWWGMVKTSGDGGATWSEARRLPDGILGPIKNKPVVLSHGGWLSPSSTETPEGWRLYFELSRDQGETWVSSAQVDPGPGLDAIQPSLLHYADGRLQALARTRQGVIAATWSSDRGRSWSPLVAIDLPNPSSGTDAVTLADGRQVIVYNHSAHRPETPGKGVRYPLRLALSEDGIHWQPVLTLEDTPLPEGYAYPAIIQSADGLLHITYTRGRRAIKHVVVDPARL